jgi:hypothetical protein
VRHCAGGCWVGGLRLDYDDGVGDRRVSEEEREEEADAAAAGY